ncbi:DsbA family protein [Candidatus Micrarchaeota archaeon]|nr:DsbA family protein [Candidatus Micrarchaeota archaeon]
MPKKTAKVKTTKEEKVDKKQEQTNKPTTMTDKEMFYVAIIVLLIGVIIYLFVTSGFGAEKEKIKNEIKTELGQKGSLPTLSNYLGSLPPLGDNNAPITFIEFGDYQCEFCKKFYNEVESIMISKYLNTSKVKFYYRDFPQPEIHNKAMLASHATRCANEQDKFWEMHNKLYQTQNLWDIGSVSSAKQKFQEYANELELNMNQFNSCVDSEKYKNEVNADIQDATRLGISGTPTFVIQIPKDKTTLDDLKKVRTVVRGTSLIQQEDKYTIIIVGARAYSDFKAFFDLVN